jgi:hypothetical protein
MKLTQGQAYTLGALAAAICVAIGVYYLVVGPYKLLVSDDPHGQHIKHALVFFALAVVSLIAARFVANAGKPAN